jgi:hypothetical protein
VWYGSVTEGSLRAALDRIALDGNPFTRVDRSRSVLAALYMTCKNTVMQSLLSTVTAVPVKAKKALKGVNNTRSQRRK